ncbi:MULTISPECIES: hypothetical protein [Flavobacterium]|uniref:hypothetical protein n=1 Tax=Flavobacterium TaxID=237 RepID=UPI0021159186|nr:MULTISPECIES: hypothetical protein [Flavobacterium]UUF14172.1 hypothetical protein NLJ00_23260 [Flavobacterium panici]
MGNKYIKCIWIIIFVLQFSFSQNKEDLIFKNIPKANFMLYTPDDISNLLIYSCINCSFSIEHIRDQADYSNYHDSFKINTRLFEINELLDQQGMDFYNVDYNNYKYLFVVSQVSEPSRFSYKYKHYYLFKLNKNNQVIQFKKLPINKLNKKNAFLKLAN